MKNIKPFSDSNKSFKPNYSTPQREYYQDAHPVYHHTSNTAVKKTPASIEWSNIDNYHSSPFLHQQSPQVIFDSRETVEHNIPSHMSRDEDDDDQPYFRNADDDDPSSPSSKKEEKYLRRKLKNEKNYKDLNKSLANLALKRVNRSSSSDVHTYLYNSQPQSQIERSYNFEFQPSLQTPTGIKNIIFPNNQFHSGLNISYASYANASQQNSPEKPEVASPYSRVCSPGVRKPQHNYNPYRSEQVLLTPSNKHSKIDWRSPSPIKSTDRMRVTECKDDLSTKRKEYQKPSSNNNTKFITSVNAEKSIFSHQGERRGFGDKNYHNRTESNNQSCNRILSSCSIERANVAPDTSLSFQGFTGIKDKKQVLDSRLPSKADLSDNQSVKGLDWRDKTIVLNNINHGRFGDENLSVVRSRETRGAKSRKSPSKSKDKRSSIENQDVEALKQEILQIKNDMEKRKQNYKEFEDFIKFYDHEEKHDKIGYESNSGSTWDRNSNEEHRFNSIFSTSNGTRCEGSDSKSSNNLIVSPMTPPGDGILKKNNVKYYKVSFNLKNPEHNGNSRGRDSPANPQFRGRRNQSPYFRPENSSFDARIKSRPPCLESCDQTMVFY